MDAFSPIGVWAKRAVPMPLLDASPARGAATCLVKLDNWIYRRLDDLAGRSRLDRSSIFLCAYALALRPWCDGDDLTLAVYPPSADLRDLVAMGIGLREGVSILAVCRVIDSELVWTRRDPSWLAGVPRLAFSPAPVAQPFSHELLLEYDGATRWRFLFEPGHQRRIWVAEVAQRFRSAATAIACGKHEVSPVASIGLADEHITR